MTAGPDEPRASATDPPAVLGRDLTDSAGDAGSRGSGPGVIAGSGAAFADVTAGGAAESAGSGSIVDWLLVAALTVLAGWTAVVAIAFLPQYIGPVPLPISVLLGVAAMILAPRACYALTGSMLAALLPVTAWFGVSVTLVLARNPIMPALPLTVTVGQWRVMLLLGLGSLAAAATIGLIWGDRLRRRVAVDLGGDARSRSTHG